MKKLSKSRDKKLSGVLGGFAEYFEVDPTLIRVIFIVLTIFSIGLPGIIAYIIAAFVMPEPGTN